MYIIEGASRCLSYPRIVSACEGTSACVGCFFGGKINSRTQTRGLVEISRNTKQRAQGSNVSEKLELPQVGLKPTTHSILDSCSAN